MPTMMLMMVMMVMMTIVMATNVSHDAETRGMSAMKKINKKST